MISSNEGIEKGMRQVFRPSTLEGEAGGLLSLMSSWSTKQIPGQPGIHSGTLSKI